MAKATRTARVKVVRDPRTIWPARYLVVVATTTTAADARRICRQQTKAVTDARRYFHDFVRCPRCPSCAANAKAWLADFTSHERPETP